MPKSERPKSELRWNPNDRLFEQIVVWISVVRFVWSFGLFVCFVKNQTEIVRFGPFVWISDANFCPKSERFYIRKTLVCPKSERIQILVFYCKARKLERHFQSEQSVQGKRCSYLVLGKNACQTWNKDWPQDTVTQDTFAINSKHGWSWEFFFSFKLKRSWKFWFLSRFNTFRFIEVDKFFDLLKNVSISLLIRLEPFSSYLNS